MSKWVPKRMKPKCGQAVRLVGCRAYPETGVMAGATLEWCQAAQGDWCGACQWRRKG